MEILGDSKIDIPVLTSKNNAKQLKTEDTGIKFEMKLCLNLGIQYDGKYNYSMETAEKLEIPKIKEIYPEEYKHTAKKGSRYDFTCITDETKHISAKSTKKDGKVAPQVIGQSQPKKFCDLIGIKYTTDDKLKEYVQVDILKILPILEEYTFDCPIIYYNQYKNTIRNIILNKPIKWDKYKFKWTCSWAEWNNSSTLKIIINGKEISLLEIQFHKKKRTNMAIRWFFENFLTIFTENLKIIKL
jgi:hypothetical protein